MLATRDLLAYCDTLLSPGLFKDYCPNGLQVAGKPVVRHLLTGVTASLALIEKAIDLKADAILVHHGLFWQGDDPCVVGRHHKRLSALLKHEVNLLAYHLPLDAHRIYGNNAQLAARLGLIIDDWFLEGHGPAIGCLGHLAEAMTAFHLKQRIRECLSFEPILIDARDKPIKTLAWCTGAAQRYITEAADRGVDAYITGEISEPTLHIAQETPIDFFAAGHHATERYGVKALGEHLASHFGIKHTFLDIPNPA